MNFTLGMVWHGGLLSEGAVRAVASALALSLAIVLLVMIPRPLLPLVLPGGRPRARSFWSAHTWAPTSVPSLQFPVGWRAVI